VEQRSEKPSHAAVELKENLSIRECQEFISEHI